MILTSEPSTIRDLLRTQTKLPIVIGRSNETFRAARPPLTPGAECVSRFSTVRA